MSWNISQNVTIERTTCCECGVSIYLESGHMRDLKQSRRTFYCPSGHGQHFIGRNETEELRKKLEAETKAKTEMQYALNRERSRANELAAKIEAAEKTANCPDESDEGGEEEQSYRPRFTVTKARRHLLRERGRDKPDGEAEEIAKQAITDFGYEWDDLTDRQIDAVIEYVELGQNEGVTA